VAKEIWICDHQTIKRYTGDISDFKMNLRKQMKLEGQQKKIAASKPANSAGAANTAAASVN
jgi:hypothetical protein